MNIIFKCILSLLFFPMGAQNCDFDKKFWFWQKISILTKNFILTKKFHFDKKFRLTKIYIFIHFLWHTHIRRKIFIGQKQPFYSFRLKKFVQKRVWNNRVFIINTLFQTCFWTNVNIKSCFWSHSKAYEILRRI